MSQRFSGWSSWCLLIFSAVIKMMMLMAMTSQYAQTLSKFFICTILFNSFNNPVKLVLCFPHFAEKGTEALIDDKSTDIFSHPPTSVWLRYTCTHLLKPHILFLQVLEKNQDPQHHSNKHTTQTWLADEITDNSKGKIWRRWSRTPITGQMSDCSRPRECRVLVTQNG